MNPLDELYQKVEYNNGEITILELFINDPIFFHNNCQFYKINQVSRLFLISHQVDLSFNYYCNLDTINKLIKYNNIADKFGKAYNNFIVSGFSFYSIIKYTYTEFYTISSVIDDIHNKKYFWRRIVEKTSKKLFANINNQTLYLNKTKEKYMLVFDYMHINIPYCLFKYVDEYIEKSHRITRRKIIVAGILYRSEKDKLEYLEQQKKRYERKLERANQIKFIQRTKEKQKIESQYAQKISDDITIRNSITEISNNKNVLQDNTKKRYQINHNNFIIRCAIFKCSFKQHRINDIDASIDIIDISTNNIMTIIIPAGYCSTCNKYFIMDSTYHKIFSKGLPLCKIVDERQKIYKDSFMSVPNK